MAKDHTPVTSFNLNLDSDSEHAEHRGTDSGGQEELLGNSRRVSTGRGRQTALEKEEKGQSRCHACLDMKKKEAEEEGKERQ